MPRYYTLRMDTAKTLSIKSTSSAQTEALAEKVGRKLRGGEVIELVSDLGGGKTTFVRGLARGLGSTNRVSSPTFKISNEYNGRLKLYHFDFYRLNDSGVVANELAEVIGGQKSVVVIEWSDIVRNVLPPERLSVELKAIGENERQLAFHYPSSLSYIVEEK